VEVSSAQRSAGDNFYKVEDANHIEVCKPRNQQDMSYSLHLQFILCCQQVSFDHSELGVFEMEALVKYSIIFLLNAGKRGYLIFYKF